MKDGKDSSGPVTVTHNPETGKFRIEGGATERQTALWKRLTAKVTEQETDYLDRRR